MCFTVGDMLREPAWRDVVPMSVAQILLGSPQIFDKKGVHQIRENTCTFLCRGWQITLTQK